MSELVNEYHPSLYETSRGNPKDEKKATKEENSPPQDKSSVDELDFISANISPPVATTPNWNVDPLEEVASPSLEMNLERELSESIAESASDSDDHDTPLLDEEEPSQYETQRLERACINLIKQAHEDRSSTTEPAATEAQNPPINPLENFERDLAAIQASNSAIHDQAATPGHDHFFTTNTQAPQPPSDTPPYQPALPPHTPVAGKSSNWKWRATVGSAVMLAALTATGSMLGVYQHPSISGKIAGVVGIVNPETTAIASTNVEAQPVLPNQVASLASTNVTEVFDAPVPLVTPVEDGENKTPEQVALTSPTVDPVTDRNNQIDVLNVNLKLEQAHMAGLRAALDTESAENLPKLLEDTVKTQTEIISLKKQIAALKLELAGQFSVEPSLLVPETQIGQEPANTNKWDSSLAALKTEPAPASPSPTPAKTRDPAAVKLAIAATPGLYSLDANQLKQLSEKLVNGECLVPALSSFFSQVPALVMRDMVRQFDGEC